MTNFLAKDKSNAHVPTLIIGAVVCAASGAFAYTAGWLTPNRITAENSSHP